MYVIVCGVSDDGCGGFYCHKAVKHIEKIFNYCEKSLAAKAMVSSTSAKYDYFEITLE